MRRVIVYTIVKDEAQFIERWVRKHAAADVLDVLDTGSSDGTIEKLETLKKEFPNLIANVHYFNDFRFDVARNFQLDLISLYAKQDDVLFQIDADEYVVTPGWADIVRRDFNGDAGSYDYIFSWKDKAETVPLNEFLAEKIHSVSYRWEKPVHEVLTYNGDTVIGHIELRLEHHTKAKASRMNYISLLRTRYAEFPQDSRNTLYYGRELYFLKHYEDARMRLMDFVDAPDAWIHEKGYAAYLISRCFLAEGKAAEAVEWALEAIRIDPLELYARDITAILKAGNFRHLLSLFPKTYKKSNFYWDEQ
jgi:glycosyltransferase involved in cell wall biosynthesis